MHLYFILKDFFRSLWQQIKNKLQQRRNLGLNFNIKMRLQKNRRAKVRESHQAKMAENLQEQLSFKPEGRIFQTMPTELIRGAETVHKPSLNTEHASSVQLSSNMLSDEGPEVQDAGPKVNVSYKF